MSRSQQLLEAFVINGLRAAQSGSVRHKIFTKTEKYSVQAGKFIQKYSGQKE